MKLFVCLMLASFMALTSCANSGCTYEGHQIETNKSYQPAGQCASFTCQEDGSVTGLNCPSEFAKPPCELVPEDPTKPYPKCCAHYINC